MLCCSPPSTKWVEVTHIMLHMVLIIDGPPPSQSSTQAGRGQGRAGRTLHSACTLRTLKVVGGRTRFDVLRWGRVQHSKARSLGSMIWVDPSERHPASNPRRAMAVITWGWFYWAKPSLNARCPWNGVILITTVPPRLSPVPVKPSSE